MKDINNNENLNVTEHDQAHQADMMSGQYQIEPAIDDKGDYQEEDIPPTNSQVPHGSGPTSKAVIAMALLVLFFVALVVLLFSGLTYFVERFRQGSDEPTLPETTLSSTDMPLEGELDGRHFSIEDATRLPDQGEKKALSTVEIAALVGPATVSIEADIQLGFSQEAQVFGSSGSGFIISEDGYIVTNQHVIVGAQTVRVVIPGYDDAFVAQVVGIDDRTDIAVLKVIVDEPLPFAVMGNSDLLMPGELAVAIGNPFGELAGTVTVGVISAVNREVSFAGGSFELIQTDASVNTGNSGGPLLNSFGEVVGVTNAKISTGEGLGFAIPINAVRDIINEIIEQGYVSGRPIMGVVVVEVDYRSADAYGWPVGVYVRSVTENGPADKAGLQSGDIILSMNDQPVLTTDDVLLIRNSLEVGDQIIIEAYRNGEQVTLTMVLEEGILS